MNIHLHRRDDGSQALYIDGNLQFDSRDEAIYHESLALPALCLAENPKRVLICGGGDGLALREALRFPAVEHVTLVDCSSEIIELSRTEFSQLNDRALEDHRVTVEIADALAYPIADRSYDVIVCDFTFPTTVEGALGFAVEWYEKLGRALRDGGTIAINAVSPQNTPSAFACLVSTVRAAGLKTLPYRVCIPSFRDQGFGAWGFILASKKQLSIRSLERIKSPVVTKQVDLNRLARGAHFTHAERLAFNSAPVNRSDDQVLLGLLLNPDESSLALRSDTPPEYPNLLRHIEVTHPYHSRLMIETLAEHVAGSLKSIDLRKLVAELTKRAKNLPLRILEELETLREYLANTVLDAELWGMWAARLFATILIVMTLANSICPDPAFAKGHAGLGHSSFSRGFSEHESFGGGTSMVTSAPISGRGFRSGYGYDPVDIYGYHYSPRVYFYGNYGGYGNYYGGGGSYFGGGSGGGGHQPLADGKQHKPLFVLDDDLLAMENGDFVVPLSDTTFLVISDGKVNMVDAKTGKLLYPVFAEPKLFDEIRTEVAAQGKDLNHEVTIRRDWLSWAGWTADIFASVKADNAEYMNLQDLQRRLEGSIKKLGSTREFTSIGLEEGAVELFVGCHILSDNRIALYGPGGHPDISDGKTLTTWTGKKSPLEPELKASIVSVLKKMIQESQQDIASDQQDMVAGNHDIDSTNIDLAQYQSFQMQNGYDPSYEVDYGTDSIPVGQAIQLTQQDLASIQTNQQQLQLSLAKNEEHLARFKAALQAWSE